MPKPEKRFVVGSCAVSVFRNMVETQYGERALPSVQLQKWYRDKNGKLQTSKRLFVDDLQFAITALQKMYEYLVTTPAPKPETVQSALQDISSKPSSKKGDGADPDDSGTADEEPVRAD